MKSPLFLTLCATLVVAACSAGGGAIEPQEYSDNGGATARKSSNSQVCISSSSQGSRDSTQDSLSSLLDMVNIEAIKYTLNNTEFSISEFSISQTEITQKLYSQLMGGIAKEDALGDNYPVFNVNWFEAALFCNALSKKAGLDTAYIYTEINSSGKLLDLSINYKSETVRLPTEMEWEIAARAGTKTKYYWDTEVASDYAYYAQSKGPVAVASYTPNAYDLYDMCGNVAEWVNDWYGAYPTTSQKNYTGPAEGTYKGIRGGGWSDKATALASSERNKKDPLYRSQTIGFRIVHSKGF